MSDATNTRPITWLYTAALAAGEVVVSPWVRTTTAADLVDGTGTAHQEAYDKRFLAGHVLNPDGSAALGLVFQFSENGTTVSHSLLGQIVNAGVDFAFRIPTHQGRHIRLQYTHGAVATAAAAHVMRFTLEQGA